MRLKIIFIFFCFTCFWGISNECRAAEMPDYRTILTKFLHEYKLYGKPALFFVKKLDNWFICMIEDYGEYDSKKEELFWSATKGGYQKLSFKKALPKENDYVLCDFIRDPKLAGLYDLLPYFGYPRYEKDIIQHYKGRTQLSTREKEILAFASKRASEMVFEKYAINNSNLFHDFETYSYTGYEDDTDKVNTFISLRNEELRLLDEIRLSNPGYELTGGRDISFEYANQSMQTWLYLQMANRANDAKIYLKDNLYDECWRAIARQTVTCLPANAVYFCNAGSEYEALAIWYLQEKEGLRNDVSVVNTFLLTNSEYIILIKQGFDKQKPLPLSMSDYFIRHALMGAVQLGSEPDEKGYIDRIIDWEAFITKISNDTPVNDNTDKFGNYIIINALKLRIEANWPVIKKHNPGNKSINLYGPNFDINPARFLMERNDIVLLDLIGQLQWSRYICMPYATASKKTYLKDYFTLCGTYIRVDLPSYERRNNSNDYYNVQYIIPDTIGGRIVLTTSPDNDGDEDNQESYEGAGEVPDNDMPAPADTAAALTTPQSSEVTTKGKENETLKIEAQFYYADTGAAIDCFKDLKTIHAGNKRLSYKSDEEICIEDIREAEIDFCKHLDASFPKLLKESLLKHGLEISDHNIAPLYYSGLSAAEVYISMGNTLKAKQLIIEVLDNLDHDYIKYKKDLELPYLFDEIAEILESAANVAANIDDHVLQERIRKKLALVKKTRADKSPRYEMSN